MQSSSENIVCLAEVTVIMEGTAGIQVTGKEVQVTIHYLLFHQWFLISYFTGNPGGKERQSSIQLCLLQTLQQTIHLK